MSTFVKIKALRPSLSNSEAKLADFTLSSGEKIRALSSIELAKAAGVSQSSVVKFAQKLGYKGFPAFKLAVVDALNEQSAQSTPIDEHISSNDPIEQIAEKILIKQKNTLLETQKLNSPKQFENAIQLIKSAKKVLICALGSTFTMAQDISLKLHKLGIPALAHTDETSAASFIATMGKDDLLIVLSTTGRSKSLNKLASLAKENEAKCLAITRYGNNDLADIADESLFSIGEESPLKHTAMQTRTSQSYLIDVLFVSLAQSNLHWQKRIEKANEHIQAVRQL